MNHIKGYCKMTIKNELYIAGYKLTHHVGMRMTERNISLGTIERLIRFGHKTDFKHGVHSRVYFTSMDTNIVVVCANNKVLTVLYAGQSQRGIDYVYADICKRRGA